MTVKQTLIMCFLTSLLLMSIGTASADVAQGNETQITTNETGQSNSAIYGNTTVWVDERNGYGYENTEIYMYNNSTETRVTTNESLKYSPVIYGDKIVWEDNRNGNWDIYMYNISTSAETQITRNESDQYSPGIYEDRIIWADGRNGGGSLDADHWPQGNWDIYVFNLSTSIGTRINTNESWKTSPAIYGDKVIWVDGRNGEELQSHQIVDGDLYMYNLSTSEETPIATNMSSDVSPDIYGDKVVWTDDHNGNSDVYMYNLSTLGETQITTNETEQWGDDIYGDRVVWTDNRNGNYDIYMFTIDASGKEPVETIL